MATSKVLNLTKNGLEYSSRYFFFFHPIIFLSFVQFFCLWLPTFPSSLNFFFHYFAILAKVHKFGFARLIKASFSLEASALTPILEAHFFLIFYLFARSLSKAGPNKIAIQNFIIARLLNLFQDMQSFIRGAGFPVKIELFRLSNLAPSSHILG